MNFAFIEYLQDTQNTHHALLAETKLKTFHDSGEPYFLTSLPITGHIFLDSNERLLLVEHHLSTVKDPSKDSHYTAYFSAGVRDRDLLYRLHVYFNQAGEPNGQITWDAVDSSHSLVEAIILDAPLIKQLIEFAQFHSSGFLSFLSQERPKALHRLRESYDSQLIQYDVCVDTNPLATNEQLHCLESAKEFALEAMQIDISFQRHYNKVLRIIEWIQTPKLSSAMNSVVRATEMKAEPAPVEEITLVAEQHSDIHNAVQQRAEWEALLKSAHSLKRRFFEGLPPNSIDGKVNATYIYEILDREQQYSQFLQRYLILEDNAEQQAKEMQRACKSIHQEISIKRHSMLQIGVTGLLLMSIKNKKYEPYLDQFTAYAAYVKPQIFLSLIKEDRADLVLFLLQNGHSLTTTQLTVSVGAGTVFAAQQQKSILEVVIAQRALACLTAMGEKYRLNFLGLASDGLPLASQLFKLDVLDNFRVLCVSNIAAFDLDAFYKSLLSTLTKLPSRDEELHQAKIAYELFRRSHSKRFVYDLQVEFVSALPEEYRRAVDNLMLSIRTVNPVKFAQLQALRHEVNTKIQQMIEHDPEFREKIKAASGALFNELNIFINNGPQELIERFQQQTHDEVEKQMDLFISYLETMNEFLYYSLPVEGLASYLSATDRAQLRAHHLNRLQSLNILTHDPIATIKQYLESMQQSLEELSLARTVYHNALLNIQQKKDSGLSLSMGDFERLVNTFDALAKCAGVQENPSHRQEVEPLAEQQIFAPSI